MHISSGVNNSNASQRIVQYSFSHSLYIHVQIHVHVPKTINEKNSKITSNSMLCDSTSIFLNREQQHLHSVKATTIKASKQHLSKHHHAQDESPSLEMRYLLVICSTTAKPSTTNQFKIILV